ARRLLGQERGEALAQAFVAEGHEERRKQGDAELFGALLHGANHQRVARCKREHLPLEVLISQRLEHVAGIACSGGQSEDHKVRRSRVERCAELGSLDAFLDDEAEFAQRLAEEPTNVLLAVSDADKRRGPSSGWLVQCSPPLLVVRSCPRGRVLNREGPSPQCSKSAVVNGKIVAEKRWVIGSNNTKIVFNYRATAACSEGLYFSGICCSSRDQAEAASLGCSSEITGRTGSRQVTVVPWPSRLVMRKLPPCSSISAREMASPSPLP